jgi:hypothetical protein
LLGGGGDYDSSSDDDDSSDYEYDYEEDEEEFVENTKKEMKPGFVRNLKELCDKENYYWNPDDFISKNIDPKFDYLITVTRKNTPGNV